MTGTVAADEPVALEQRPRHALARCIAGLTEARPSLVGQVVQHPPHHRAPPVRAPGGRSYRKFIELAGNRADAHVIAGVIAVDIANHRRLRFEDFVEGIAVRGFLVVAVAIGRAPRTEISPRSAR